MKVLGRFQAASEHYSAKVFSTWLNSDGREAASTTYEEVWDRAGAVAHLLRVKLKICKGDRVMLCFGFGLDFFMAMLGCFRAGVVAVPVYPPNPAKMDSSLRKLALISKDCGARMCLADKEVMTLRRLQLVNPFKASKWPKGLKWESMVPAGSKASKCFDEVSLDDGDIAFLQYTSGSTGQPKGVMVTFANLEHNLAVVMSRAISHVRTRVGVSWLPQYHDMGLVVGLMM